MGRISKSGWGEVACADDVETSLPLSFVMADVNLVTEKDLLGQTGINMTLRYTHLVPEHKAQAVAKLKNRYKAIAEQSQ